MDPEPSFLRECRRRGDNLYVVTEAVELTKDSILYDNGSVTISGMLSSPQFTFIKVWNGVTKEGASLGSLIFTKGPGAYSEPALERREVTGVPSLFPEVKVHEVLPSSRGHILKSS